MKCIICAGFKQNYKLHVMSGYLVFKLISLEILNCEAVRRLGSIMAYSLQLSLPKLVFSINIFPEKEI